MKGPHTKYPYLPLILIILFTPPVFSECYFPNGTLFTDPAYQPCPGFDGIASMCCAINRTNPFGGADTNGWTANKCLPNGLCLDGFTTIDQHGETTLVQQYWRDLCTSQNWDDGGCLKACIGNANDRTIRMTPCGNPNTSTTWCCGDNTDCCNSSNAQYIAATLQGYIATLTTTSTASSSTITTSTSPISASSNQGPSTSSGSTTTSTSPTSSTPSNQASSIPSAGLSTAAKTGIGIGVGVGAIVVLAGLAWILVKKRRAKPASEEFQRPFHAANSPPKELASTEVARELPSNSSTLIQELHGDSVRK